MFTPAGIARLNDTIEGTVNNLLDEVQDQGEMEFIADFGLRLPTTVMLDVFALDHTEYDRFMLAADTIIECFESLGSADGPSDELLDSANEVLGDTARFIQDVADERRGSDGEDLLSLLVRAQGEEPDRLSPDELSSMVLFLVTAGFETTTYSAANILLSLFKYPDQFEILRADPGLVRSTVEEALRYEPGVMVSSTLFAAVDQEVAGMKISAGDRMLISNHAANHDPVVFEDPHIFDIRRKPNRQMSFGRGPHSCLGANLARAELVMFLKAVLERIPDVRPVSDEIEWKHSHVIRGPKRFEIAW